MTRESYILYLHQPEASASNSFFYTPPAGLEPATTGLEIRCSIQLSYGGSIFINYKILQIKFQFFKLDKLMIFIYNI